MNDKKLAEAFAQLWNKSAELNLQPARLGRLDGVGTYTIAVADRPGWVHISKGANGEGGSTLAWDAIGVALVGWQLVKVRMEHGRLVVREAEQLAADTSADELSDLTDVQLTSLQDGEGLAWDSGTSKWINVALSGSAGAPSPHDLSGVHHSGQLAWGDLSKTGSDLADLATRSHADLTGVTANQHHNQQHVITGADHTVTGSALDVVGLSTTNTLAVLTPSDNPGAAAAILRTSSAGGLQLDTTLFVVNATDNIVSVDSSLLVVDGDENTVTMDGTLFSLDADTEIVSMADGTLYVDGINERVGVNIVPSGAALDVMVVSNSDHTQRIKQKSGQTGRLWRVENTTGDELIVLDSQGNLQSGNPGFVSGLTGWQITSTGTAEFNNVWVRGELHATVFVKDEVHISGGTLLVATGGKLYSDAAIDTVTVDTETLQFETEDGVVDWEVEIAGGTVDLEIESVLNIIEVEDSPSGPGFYFQDGEIVRSKTEIDTGVTDLWLEIISGIQLDGYQRYSVTKRSGSDNTLPAGSGVASYGYEGDGRIMLTSDLNYAPYIDVFNVGAEPWNGDFTPRVRMGRLDGVGVTAVSGIEQYGMIMGTDLSDANSPYIVASDLQLALHKVDLTLNDGTNTTGELTAEGNLTLGTNIGTTNGKSFQVISGGADAGDVIIGRLASNYIKWDNSAGSLTVNGTLTIGGDSVPTTTTLASAVSSTLSAASSDATAKASGAQTAAQDYGNARRVLGVSGTWTATDADTISWTSASVRLGDGTTKSLTNGNTGNMSARTYLYVNPAAAAPLTVSATTSLGSLPAGYMLIAVCDPGTDKASVNIVAGSTYISGDNIATGSIVAANIKASAITSTLIDAGAVTAAKINVTNLQAVNANTGSLSVSGTLTMGTSGKILSSGKSYGDSNAGIFLGYDSSAYKFEVRGSTSANRLLFDGSSISIITTNPLQVSRTSPGVVFEFNEPGGTAQLDWDYPILEINAPTTQVLSLLADGITTDSLIIDSSGFRIVFASTPSSGSGGTQGDFRYDTDFIYVYTSVGWKRATLSSY